jgi:hypothetical protein
MAKVEITEELLEQIEKLSSVLNQQQLSDFLGITDRGFRKIMERDERVSSAYKKGRAKGVASIGTSLLKQAQSGNTTAMMFYLKTQAGWRETQHIDHTTSDGSMKPTVIELVGVSSESTAEDS